MAMYKALHSLAPASSLAFVHLILRHLFSPHWSPFTKPTVLTQAVPCPAWPGWVEDFTQVLLSQRVTLLLSLPEDPCLWLVFFTALCFSFRAGVANRWSVDHGWSVRSERLATAASEHFSLFVMSPAPAYHLAWWLPLLRGWELPGCKKPVCSVHRLHPAQSRRDASTLNKWSRAASGPGWHSVVEGPPPCFCMEQVPLWPTKQEAPWGLLQAVWLCGPWGPMLADDAGERFSGSLLGREQRGASELTAGSQHWQSDSRTPRTHSCGDAQWYPRGVAVKIGGDPFSQQTFKLHEYFRLCQKASAIIFNYC